MCSVRAKCLCSARFWRPYLLWTINIVAPSATKWNNACDRNIGTRNNLHQSNETSHTHIVFCWAKIQDCKLVFCGALLLPEICKIPESTSGGALCVFGSQTCVTVFWMCKKQTAVSHSSAEADIFFTQFVMEGSPALRMWDCVSETCSRSDAKGKLKRPSGKRHSYLIHGSHVT